MATVDAGRWAESVSCSQLASRSAWAGLLATIACVTPAPLFRPRMPGARYRPLRPAAMHRRRLAGSRNAVRPDEFGQAANGIHPRSFAKRWGWFQNPPWCYGCCAMVEAEDGTKA